MRGAWSSQNVLLAIAVALLTRPLFASEAQFPIYFDLGDRLTQEFRGTYEFKYRRLEFIRSKPTAYVVRSSGDQSPSEDRLALEKGYVVWILGHSGERWLKLKSSLRRGDSWAHALRGWKQRYHVEATDLSVTVPGGEFKHCAKVTISWVAHEHDLEGPQKIVLYLAPRLGIIKREVWNSGDKEHEEVLTSYASSGEK
jgi:hypothetical protein